MPICQGFWCILLEASNIHIYDLRYFIIYKFCRLCYNIYVTDSDTGNREEVSTLEYMNSFLISIAASVIAYYICKWLDAGS